MQDLNDITQSGQANIIRGISLMTKDMRFVGLFTIIYGVINSLTIIGAFIGVPLIFMGIRIREAADHYDYFNASGDMNALQNAIDKQYKYFNIQKILVIVSLFFIALYIIVIIGFISIGVFNQPDEIFSMLN